MMVQLSWMVAGFTSADWIGVGDGFGGWYGYSVSTAGDVNGDGYDDVVLGAPFYGNFDGRAYVYHGSASGLDVYPAWVAEAVEGGIYTGIVVSGGGDVDGDGFDDVLVCTVYPNIVNDRGQVAVFHGDAAGLDIDPWIAVGPQVAAEYCTAAAVAGDLNGDGFDDIAVGAPYYDNGGASEGAAFVHLGSAAGLEAEPSWTAEGGKRSAWFGDAVASAGDVNADGLADLVVGARGYDEFEDQEGRAYLWLGSVTGLATDPAWIVAGDQWGAAVGTAIASAGDVDADGYDDVVVGAPWYDNVEPGEGRAWVYHGTITGLATVAAWMAEPDQDFASFGEVAASAGDLDGDGFDDLIVGAPDFDNGTADEGAAFVFLGSTTGLETTATFVVDSDQTYSEFGTTVASAGDVDADGYDDVLVGAPEYGNGGRAYLYAGACYDTVDTDGDLVVDSCDVCADVYDPPQEDADADGFGDLCDCASDDPTVHPGATETCDGLDNDCAGGVPGDELDLDGDGEATCAGDCDDTDPALFSNQIETCNGRDDNCDGALGSDEQDVDGDLVLLCAGDCDDVNAGANANQPEACGDAVDNDCDGAVDEGCDVEPDPPAPPAGCSCNGGDGIAGLSAFVFALLAMSSRIGGPGRRFLTARLVSE